MYVYKCEICDEVLESEKSQASVSTMFSNHLRKKHNLSIYEYIVKVYYNNTPPTCACGCGKPVRWNYKNALYLPNHGFNKFFHCGHVGCSEERNEKIKKTLEKRNNDEQILIERITAHISIENLKKAAQDFKNHETLKNISDIYGIDKRLLCIYWKKLNILSEEDIKKYSQYNQYTLAILHRKKKFENYIDKCKILYDIIYASPGQYTIKSLLKYFNTQYPELCIETDPYIVRDKLVELYGVDIQNYLQYGYHSKEEIEFAKILQFYFGKKNVKIGYCFNNVSNNEKEYYIYDICVSDKILIEYDSTGFYHQTQTVKKRDKTKELYAINKGFIFMRLSLDDVKNPETIIKIKTLLK